MKHEQPPSVREVVERDLEGRHNPIFRNLPGNADEQREEMRRVLDSSPTLIIERQYEKAGSVLKHFNLVDAEGVPVHGGVPLPDMQAVADSFSIHQLRLAVSISYHRPTLLLVPEMNFLGLRDAMNDHRLKNQNPAICAEPFQIDDGGTEAITGWKPIIVEGSKGPQRNSCKLDTYETLRHFVERIQTERGSKRRGLNRHDYATLMMLSMFETGQVDHLIDRNSSTILDGDSSLDLSTDTHRGIPIGKFRKYEPPRYPYENAVSYYMSQGDREGSLYGGHWIRYSIAGTTIR